VCQENFGGGGGTSHNGRGGGWGDERVRNLGRRISIIRAVGGGGGGGSYPKGKLGGGRGERRGADGGL